MRDGLPIISLVVSCVAVLVALVGILSPPGSETSEAPADVLANAMGKLDSIAKDRRSMREEIQKLNDEIVEIKEASAGARGEAFDKVEVENIVKEVVEKELGKRILIEAAKVGAAVKGEPAAPAAPAAAAKAGAAAPAAPKPGPPAPVAPAAAGAKSPMAQEFDAMVGTIKTRLALDDGKTGSVKSVLSALRGELNGIFGEQIDAATREQKAADARKRADERLARILSEDEMAKLQAWRAGEADKYAKRFFGVQQAPP